jgi:hypothetical protein
MKAFLSLAVLMLALVACAPKPEPVPVRDPNVDVTPGLNEREPDTCHAALYRWFVGKPVAEFQAAASGKNLTVITPISLGSQEYDSSRINAFTDNAGLVTRLSCG